jgi:NADH:ubiquinone oxidoreductase subunit 5 (subunit L)/multisubunit Na+/H+ antiporter MnhA subunit
MPVEWLGLIGLAGAIGASIFMLNHGDFVGLGVIIVDRFTVFFNVTICAIGVLTILLSAGSADRDHLPAGEYYALLLFSVAGMMLMGSTRDLLVIFIALEIMSLGVYVMTGIKRASAAGAGGSPWPSRGGRRTMKWSVITAWITSRVRRFGMWQPVQSGAVVCPADAIAAWHCLQTPL